MLNIDRLLIGTVKETVDAILSNLFNGKSTHERG